jgi:hypothetical protein
MAVPPPTDLKHAVPERQRRVGLRNVWFRPPNP